MAAPAFAVYGLFLLLPAVQVSWLALQEWNGYGAQRFIGFQNFAVLWGDPAFRQALVHSLTWEVGAAALTLVGFAIGSLARHAKGGTGLLALFLFPLLIPQIVVAVIWTLAYQPLSGLVNTILSNTGLGAVAGDWLGDPRLAPGALFVAWAWSAIGVSALICRVALGMVGREYEEIALMEGAGRMWRLFHVTLPATRRLLGVAVLVNVALAAQVFDLIYVTTGGGPGNATVTLPIDMYARAFGGRTGEGAAVALVQMLAGVALAVLAFLAVRRDAGMDSGEGEPRTERRGRVLPSAVLSFLALLMALPLLWLIGVALGLAGVQFGPSATFDPTTWRLASFSQVWTGGMETAIESSLAFAVAVAVSVVALAAPAAFALNRTRGRPLIALTLLVLIIGIFQPDSVLVIPLFGLLGDLGLLNTVFGVYFPEVARAIPVAVLVIWAWLSGGSRAVLEAAAVDGAGTVRQLVAIAVPLSRPALLAAGAWAFLTSWNDYLLPSVVSQDGSLTTVPTLLGTFVGRVDTEYAALAAGCLCALAPIALLYLGLPRLARAIAGAGKGL